MYKATMTTICTLSTVSLLLIIQLNAKRLLQQAQCNCAPGEYCYELSAGPICCNPTNCATGGICLKDIPSFACVAGYECVDNPDCARCAGICIDLNFGLIKPNIGDPCSRCFSLSCPCNLCSDGVTQYGCCGGCIYQDQGSGNLICSSSPMTTESVCPTTTTTTTTTTTQRPVPPEPPIIPPVNVILPINVPGDSCTDCLSCGCSLCPDGITRIGCCGGCEYKYDARGDLFCSAVLTANSCTTTTTTTTLPPIPTEPPTPPPVQPVIPTRPVVLFPGDSCTDCLTCGCSLCPDGVTQVGCCAGCAYKYDVVGNLLCSAVLTTSSCPTTTTTTTTIPPVPTEHPTIPPVEPVIVLPVAGDSCTSCLKCGCSVCPDGISQIGCCGGCVYKYDVMGNLFCSAVLTARSCSTTTTTIPPVPTEHPTISPLPTQHPTISPLPTYHPTISPVPTYHPTISPVPTDHPTVSPVEPVIVMPPAVAGDSCTGCLTCGCSLCRDGITQIGCCGGCKYEYDAVGDLFCSAVLTATSCSTTTTTTTIPTEHPTISPLHTEHPTMHPIVAGDSCTGCLKCGCSLCPDGITQIGCCGGCEYEYDIMGELFCSAVLTARSCSTKTTIVGPVHVLPITPPGGPIIVIPPINVPGETCSGCSKCNCAVCLDGVTKIGCCSGCEYQYDAPGDLVCSAVVTEGVCPTTIAPSSSPSAAAQVIPCGGFTNCKSYTDGCNDCFCDPNGVDRCTERFCITQGIPKCNQCVFTHRLDETGHCVLKMKCKESRDCNKVYGFRCREDPNCKAPSEPEPLCRGDPPEICWDYEKVWVICSSDAECDTKNGFKCYFDANDNIGVGVCGKYQ